MRIPSGKTDQLIYFVAVDSVDLKTRKTGLTSFTVYRSRNGGAATVYTTPTVAELSAANMPGVYSLAIDEDTTIASTSDSEEMVLHITQASMAPVTRSIELYRRDTTSGNTALVDANGRVDVIKIAGTTQTARDIGASVLLSTGTGAGQLDFTSGVVKSNVSQLLGTTVSTPATAGIMDVNVKNMNNVSGAAITTIKAVQGLATDGVVPTVTTLTNLPAITSNWLTATGIAATALNGKGDWNIGKTGYALSSAGVQAIWDALTSVLTTVGSIGKKLADWTIGTAQTGDAYARLGAPAGASVSADIAAVKTQTAAIETDTAEIGTAGAGLTNINLPNQTMDIVGNITGNLSGSVGSIADGTNVAKALFQVDTAETYSSAVAGSVVKEIADNAGGGTPPTAAAIADAVWEEAIGDHSGTAGSTAEALGAAGAAGDPWTTLLPGSYGAGSAGKIIGDNINATIGSRATQTSVDDIPTNAELTTALAGADDAVLAAVAALNNLSSAQAQTAVTAALNAYDPQTRAEATADKDEVLNAIGDVPTNAELATALGTADDPVLAQVALVKAQTDQLAFTGGNLDANVKAVNDTLVTGTGATGDEWGPA